MNNQNPHTMAILEQLTTNTAMSKIKLEFARTPTQQQYWQGIHQDNQDQLNLFNQDREQLTTKQLLEKWGPPKPQNTTTINTHNGLTWILVINIILFILNVLGILLLNNTNS